jgi:hypothetical protein
MQWPRFHDANQGKEVLDLDTIWRRQEVPPALVRALLIAAAEANYIITHPPQGVRNMSEWAKQQACWSGLQNRNLVYDRDFRNCLVLAENAESAVREGRAKKTMTDGINAQVQVVKLGSGFWGNVLEGARARQDMTPKELGILQVCASIPQRLPTDAQSKAALDVLARIRGDGVE